jgi:hypothetical protein
MPMVKSIQEQQTTIEQLRSENQALKEQLNLRNPNGNNGCRDRENKARNGRNVMQALIIIRNFLERRNN